MLSGVYESNYPSLNRSLLERRYIDLFYTIVFKYFGSNNVFLISEGFKFEDFHKSAEDAHCCELVKMNKYVTFLYLSLS